MRQSLEFILGLLDRHFPAFVAAEDFEGPHNKVLGLWQQKGFLATHPEPHPLPSCPFCLEGSPFAVAGWLFCDVCGSTVDRRHLLRWRFDLDTFLRWLSTSLGLDGDVRQVGPSLWQLGSIRLEGQPMECFFIRGRQLSQEEQRRLSAFLRVLLFRPLPSGDALSVQARYLSLLELLSQDARSLRVADLRDVLQAQGTVQFDELTGSLWAGDHLLGEVPLHSKEFFFLACLAGQRDAFVSYSDLKRFVLQHAGSTESTEEATFCQRLKHRTKRWVPRIDELLVTTNKGEGYRLRGHLGKEP